MAVKNILSPFKKVK